MSLIKQIKLENNLYDIGAKWSNIDKENIIYGPSEIINFEDNKIEPLKKCIINIKAVQEGSGDSSPSNVRPINGWSGAEVHTTGQNLCGSTYLMKRIETSMASAVLDYTNNTVQFSSVATTNEAILSSKQIPWKENTQYTFILTGIHSGGTASNLWIYYTDGSRTLLPHYDQTKTITCFVTAAEKTVLALSKANSSGTTTLYCDECGIFEGVLTEEDFEPYINCEHVVNWTDQAGTVYGGTLDMLTGVLTVTHGKIIYNGSETWTSLGEGYYRPLSSMKLGFNNSTSLCDKFPFTSSANVPGIQLGYYGNSTPSVYIRQAEALIGVTTADELKSWLTANPVEVVYPLAELITYQLTPQIITSLIGQNNIWVDCGDISIELENFYSDIQNEITTNLNENTLLYNKNYSLTTSNHYITNDKISINSLDHYDNYNLYINGSTLTNHHIILQKSDNITWSTNGSDNEPAFIMKGANDKRFKFKFSNSGTNVDIGWDWTLMDGSGAFFRNSDATSNSGGFGFFARKPNTTTPTTADCTELYGYPNGLLYWKKTTGDSNPRFAINATSSSYTLYVNGTTYLKGDTKISANTSIVGCTLQYDNTLNTLNFVFD